MAPFVFTNGKLWIAGYDLSGDLNAIALDYGAEAKDGTTFAHGVRNNVGGLKTLALSCSGFWGSDGTDEPDDVVFSRVGTDSIPVCVAPVGDDGDVAYMFEALVASYMQRGQIGEMCAFDVDASAGGDSPLVRGLVLFNGAQSGDGNGTGRELGAVSSGQSLYAAIHVLALGAGTSLVAKVQSDADNTFASATDRITFAAKTDVGAELLSTAGAITDTWFRVNLDFTGGTTTATVVVVVGIK